MSTSTYSNGAMSDSDPFNSTTPTGSRTPHRYSAFDSTLFSTLANGSPTQTRRALEAHIADTDRRIRDASKLGTNLLEQKKHLYDRLKDVQTQEGSDEVSPELKKKLEELDKEYSELGRESARSLLPQSRTNEDGVNGGAVIPNGRSQSPTKPTAPRTSNRKSRNTSSRVEDLTFATEISTSLLAQVRHLQNLLAEKEEAFRQADTENARLQTEAEHTTARLKAFDDNEQRYKDENWQLDTQVQELSSQLQDTTSRHQRLEQSLKQAQSEKTTVERDTEDLKMAHSKLSDEHAALRRKHEADMGSLRRGIASGDSEKEAMQKKIADLTSQNEELARAVSTRSRNLDSPQMPGGFMETESDTQGQTTPDHSPPPSPTKTPRHGALESETLKSSLHHAHRMIQNLKNNIHREKTEKLELRRMLQDARDEVEARRADTGMVNRNKARKHLSNQDVFAKPARPDRLGARQSASEEIIDDPSWEAYEDSPARQSTRRRIEDPSTDGSDAFETANEADSTDAFETAESVVGGDTEGEETETEATASSNNLLKKRPSMINKSAGDRTSFMSTASEEYDDAFDLTTPPRNDRAPYKLRMNRDRLRLSSGTHTANDSPASFVSNSSRSSQMTAKNDLAAELDNLDDSSIVESTPSRSVLAPSNQNSPYIGTNRDTRIYIRDESVARRPQMVDSGMVTEPWEPEPATSGAAESGILGAVAGAGAAGLAILGLRSGDSDAEREAVSSDKQADQMSPELPPSLNFSSVKTLETVPVLPTQDEPKTRSLDEPTLEATRTRSLDEPLTPTLSHTYTARPAADSVPFAFSAINAQQIKPVAMTTPELSSRELSQFPKPGFSKTVVGSLPVAALPPAIEDFNSTPSRPAPSMSIVDRIIKQNTVSTSPEDAARDGQTLPSFEQSSPLALARSRSVPRRDHPLDDVFISDSAQASPSGAHNVALPSSGPTTAGDDKRVPFMPVSGNNTLSQGTPIAVPVASKTENTQPMVSVAEMEQRLKEKDVLIERLVKEKEKPHLTPAPVFAVPSPPRPATGSRSKPAETGPPPTLTQRSPRRPSNASLTRRREAPSPPPLHIPPLPSDHREVIAAASRTSSFIGSVPPGSDRVPIPASVRSSQVGRPRTPSQTRNATAAASQRQRGVSATGTRRSSISSFASELDERFQPQTNWPEYDPATTDPRMIQAITQTMIGEFMWKYTRKTGSSTTQSNNRHRRFFWIHPYTRTLYWSTQDPSRQGSSRGELKAKSVPIEAVRVVTDENPNPPGLWQKSIVILTPGKGRSIKFTAPTGMRHETWFNALSYLLLRNNAADRMDDASDQVATAAYPTMRDPRASASMRGSTTTLNRRQYGGIGGQMTTGTDEGSNTLSSLTQDEVSEFNPTLHPGRTSSRMTGSQSYRSLRSTAGRRSDIGTANSISSQRDLSYQHAQGHGQGQWPQNMATAPIVPARSKDVNALTSAPGTNIRDDEPLPQSIGGGGEFDSDGFRRPGLPASSYASSTATTGTARNSRLGSMSNRVGTFFSSARSRSMSRSRASSGQAMNISAPMAVSDSRGPMAQTLTMMGHARVDSSGTGTSQSESGQSTAVSTAESGGSTVRGSASNSFDAGSFVRPDSRRSNNGLATVENVRACCDGKHDVGDLSHVAGPSGIGPSPATGRSTTGSIRSSHRHRTGGSLGGSVGSRFSRA